MVQVYHLFRLEFWLNFTYINRGRLAVDEALANPVRSGRKQP